MLKKMMLLAVAAAALVAFVVPASASADVWTDNHNTLEEGQTANQSFEGVLKFFAGPTTTFACNVTVEIEAEGPSGGRVTKFNPTTTECEGTGGFAGCELEADSSNISEGWNINIASTPILVTASSGNITIHNEYAGCAAPDTDLAFTSITVTPTQVEGTITKLSISGTATNGAVAAGSVTPESSLTLGIE